MQEKPGAQVADHGEQKTGRQERQIAAARDQTHAACMLQSQKQHGDH